MCSPIPLLCLKKLDPYIMKSIIAGEEYIIPFMKCIVSLSTCNSYPQCTVSTSESM